VRRTEILCSSFAAAVHLQRQPLQPGQKVFVIGQSGITEELDLHSIPNFTVDTDEHAFAQSQNMVLGPGVKVDHDKDVGAVVVGFDPHINYYKIQYAQLCINHNEGCQFIATNMDCVAHVTDAQEWAEAGAMVGAVAAAVGTMHNDVWYNILKRANHMVVICCRYPTNCCWQAVQYINQPYHQQP
jgi:ribonucleotide monophosphatase NagD (HAD superfamily)